MRNVLFVASMMVAITGCGGGRTTFARYPAASVAFDRTAQDPKALEVADKALAAVGGETAWAKAKQLEWEQSITEEGKEVIAGMQAWDRWNGRHRGKARREGGDLVVIRDIYGGAENAFIENPETQKMRKIEGGADEAIKTAKERWEFDTAILFMPFLLEEPGTKLTYVEEGTTADGKPADIIAVTFDPKDKTRTATFRILVNRDTGLIDRYEMQKAGQGEDQRLGYAPTAWGEGGGIKYPTAVKNLGLETESFSYKDLKVGEPDENLYIPPPLL